MIMILNGNNSNNELGNISKVSLINLFLFLITVLSTECSTDPGRCDSARVCDWEDVAHALSLVGEGHSTASQQGGGPGDQIGLGQGVGRRTADAERVQVQTKL